MNKQKLIKYLIPIGLLLSSSTFMISHFMHVSDAVNGFLKGVPIGIMLMGVIMLKRSKPAC